MKKQKYIMVMSKAPQQEIFGLDTAFSVNVLGKEEALKKAIAYMEDQASLWTSIQFKLQEGEW